MKENIQIMKWLCAKILETPEHLCILDFLTVILNFVFLNKDLIVKTFEVSKKFRLCALERFLLVIVCFSINKG